MSVSPHRFRPRKRQPSAGSFIPPNLSDQRLIHSLIFLSREISSVHTSRCSLLKKSMAGIVRKVKLISVIFESLVKNEMKFFSPSAFLCFEELYIVLERINALIEDLASGSKTWMLTNINSISRDLQEIVTALSTLLDIFPADEMNLDCDARELLNLVRKQCVNSKIGKSDYADVALRAEVLYMLDEIERGVIPERSKLGEIFNRLQLKDSASCGDEIERLEDEIQNQDEEKSKNEIVSLIGLVRYAKCVLYGTTLSGPRIELLRKKSASEVNIPSDFRCPISLDLMQDPVVVATGQTYDRPSIMFWIESGHNTCPKTGQTLPNSTIIPNHALRNLIAMWCREQRIPFGGTTLVNPPKTIHNKTAIEATKMTISFLLSELRGVKSTEIANHYVYELRVLAKVDSDSRACIAEAGALPMLVKFLASEDSNLQINAVTTILNLSILETNRRRIMETEGVTNGVIEVLRSGATWEAKGNAAATIFSLIDIHAYKKLLGRKTRVIKGLIDLAREGPSETKRDALVAILSLAKDRDTVVKLVEGGVVELCNELIDELPEEVVIILELVVKRGGLLAVSAAYPMIKKLTSVLRTGTDRARENTTATLVNICRKGGTEAVAELATVSGIERVIWEMMGMGTERGRRKAASLLRILRRWAAGFEEQGTLGYTTVSNITSTRIVLPGVTNL